MDVETFMDLQDISLATLKLHLSDKTGTTLGEWLFGLGVKIQRK